MDRLHSTHSRATVVIHPYLRDEVFGPAGRMTPEESLTITVNIRQNFPRVKKTNEKIHACHGTLNALKWVFFLFTCTFELYCTILHGFCITGMASWWFIQINILTLFSFTI